MLPRRTGDGGLDSARPATRVRRDGGEKCVERAHERPRPSPRVRRCLTIALFTKPPQSLLRGYMVRGGSSRGSRCEDMWVGSPVPQNRQETREGVYS